MHYFILCLILISWDTQSENKNDGALMEQYVDEFLQNPANDFSLTIGNEHFRGKNILVIKGSGSMTVTNIMGTKKQEFSKTLDENTQKTFVALLKKALPFMRQPQSMTAVPDEETFDIILQGPSLAMPIIFKILHNQRYKNREFGEFINFLQNIAVESSGGILKYL